ncbi:hydroxyethylthiazole kinase [Paenactinomyces guangxiensis]|uniref:Hydroxyethylthiazole kinase n=1 Tax=Paenactinomyces guangxiensis TaxID=1490290 RepID=A0A7W1WN50_9BACL|nr:hydroxyethylthiazole kinase [Paenactinomyces guangxiensis]MBA4492900.1 hydroxyethylthiazole kinase [Paenactinomyces guangxiensis]MBH8590251.1 hydroxyethylthiazole kinase [Paenactinomyces guangxiensis]
MDTVDSAKWLEKVRRERPLVHNITNLVVTNIAANALLALGASPVMAYAKEEVADMAGIANGLSLNMGTLDEAVVEAMLIAGRAANEAGVPVVFDPVGVGATPYRNEVAKKITEELNISVLRGNAAEIGVLLGAGGEVKGVDAASATDSLGDFMKQYAKKKDCVVIATGKTDLVTDGDTIWQLHNGHELLTKITGSGCMATAILGAFAGIAGKEADVKSFAEASMAALTCYNVAGELAAEKSNGPGTFQAALFDALFKLEGERVNKRARVTVR